MRKANFNRNCINVGIFNPIEYIVKLYQRGMSATEISEYMKEKHNIQITNKGISDKIKEKIQLRTYRERKLNAIKRGRMIYHKKPANERYKSGSLSAKIRMNVLARDSFQCTICGNSPKTGSSLEIHHKNGNSSDLDNLQTLCYLCHRGLHYNKKNS
jgi:5-methylcytosine-specific restriction endonuclease McrA